MRLTREQILAFRRRTGGLDERMPLSATSLRVAAWAGLQDSMPRAALLSLHARLYGVTSSSWEHGSLAQLWGPRYSTYVVPKRDFALFSVGRVPDARAEEIAELVRNQLNGRRITDRELMKELGTGNRIRYAATTGTIAIRWEGARAPEIWSVPRPKISPAKACSELAKRYLHIFGPTTAKSFARWAGISQLAANAAFASLEVLPTSEGLLLAEDEPLMRAPPSEPAPARLLPSGDAYWLLDGAERALLVPDAKQQAKLWTPRVWPGALLVDGEVRGTWRRAQHKVDIETWGRLSRAQRDAVEAEAATLPLPALDRDIAVAWA